MRIHTRRAAHIILIALTVASVALAGCRGKKQQPEATPTPQAASAATSRAATALKTDVQKLDVKVPLSAPKIDGLLVSAPSLGTSVSALKAPSLNLAVALPSIGSIAVPSVNTSNFALSVPTGIPVGVPTGIPSGFATPPSAVPSGFATPPSGIPSGFATPPAGIPSGFATPPAGFTFP